MAAKCDSVCNTKQELKTNMHILIVNSSSFSMTLSNSLCKHFYIHPKLKGKTLLKHLVHDSLSIPFGVCVCIRMQIHAGVPVYILYLAVHIQEINMTPGVK